MSAQDHLDHAQALSSAVRRYKKPSSVRHAWHLKRRITKAQQQLDQVKQRITQEMRVLNDEKVPEVAAVGAGLGGCPETERKAALATYREARNRVNDLLLETWEIKFDLDDYIQTQSRTQTPDKDQ